MGRVKSFDFDPETTHSIDTASVDPEFAADDELIDAFIQETLESIDAAEQAVFRLQANRSDQPAIDTLFRCFHSAKGTAGFLGLEGIVEFAHLVESLLDQLRSSARVADAGVVDLLIRSVDVLRACTLDLRDDGQSGRQRARVLSSEIGSVMAQPNDAPPEASAVDEPEVDEAAAEASDAWTRVRTDRLDQLLETVGELVVAHSMLGRHASSDLPSSSPVAQLVGDCNKIVRELQEISVGMRMVPLRATFQRAVRLARVLSRKVGKPLELRISGEDTEIDRNLVALMVDPLLHLLRNAADHGIEAKAEREAKGKPAVAQLRLSAYHAAGNIVIELQDDGRGIDISRVREKAIARGLIEADRRMDEKELLSLIFSPGFSTAEQVTDLSGRGVGLDVVRRNIEQVRGRIEVESTPDAGTRFRLLLPLTLAITDGMLVQVGAQRFILPILNIQHSYRPAVNEVKSIAGRGEFVTFRGDILPVLRLHRVLNVPNAVERPEQALLVVVAAADRRCALLVDALVGQQQVVSRSVDSSFGSSRGVAGAAILGDGRVGLILDVADLITLTRNSGAKA